MGGDSRVTQSAEDLIKELDELNVTIKNQSDQLEAAIAQVDQYQVEVQNLRQQIVQVEQQLRTTMAPTYLPHDRDQALRDQQVGCRCVVFFLDINYRLLTVVSRIDGGGMNCWCRTAVSKIISKCTVSCKSKCLISSIFGEMCKYQRGVF